MSIWTHVAATIRFDDLRLPGFGNKGKPDLGKTVDYDSPEEAWDECTVPKGSEGSLTHTLWTNPHQSSLSSYTASIFGDLRDYEDVDEIIAYLDRITEGKMVRNGIATIEVEGREPVIRHYNDGKWVTITATQAA